MPLRLARVPYNIGVDICHVPRFYKYFQDVWRHSLRSGPSDPESRKGLFKLLQKILTPVEQREFWTRFDSISKLDDVNIADRCAHFLAGRWSAKEAVIKAVEHRRLFCLDIEIHPSAHGRAYGKPYAVVLDERRKSPFEADDNSQLAQQIYTGHIERTRGSQSRQLHSKPDVGQAALKTKKKKSETSHVPEPVLPDTNGQIVRISISHDEEYCVATAIAPLEPAAGDVGGEAAARDPLH